jgi:hypothetical protein
MIGSAVMATAVAPPSEKAARRNQPGGNKNAQSVATTNATPKPTHASVGVPAYIDSSNSVAGAR